MILQIESVQRLFTRRIPGFENLSYQKRLAKLNIVTLEKRRLLADLLLCYKLVTGVYDKPIENYGLCLVNDKRKTRSHDLQLSFNKCRIDSRLHFFGPRVAKVWNSLTGDVVRSSSVQIFKSSLRNVDFKKFLILNLDH